MLGSKSQKVQRDLQGVSDRRIKIMNEILAGMKTIKYNVYEDSFGAKARNPPPPFFPLVLTCGKEGWRRGREPC